MEKEYGKMTKKEFYSIYIPALEKAFNNDNVNYGFYVAPPEDYININQIDEINDYLDNTEDPFIERVGYYFDAKSHYFSSIQNISIDKYKNSLIIEMNEKKGNIPNWQI